MPFRFDPEAGGVHGEIADRVTEIDEETREAIRGVVVRGFRERTDPFSLAREIEEVVGLTSDQAQAVANYRDSLEAMGTDAERVDRLVEKYADRKLEERAETISRTEVMSALNAGTNLSWEQAVADGELPEEVVKVWIVADDELLCEICEPMDGVEAAIDDDFEGAEGPPAHPNCRCTIGLRRPETGAGRAAVDPELQRIDALARESVDSPLFELPPAMQSRIQSDPEAARRAQETFAARGKWLRSRGYSVAGLARLGRLDPTYGPSRARIAAADTAMTMLQRSLSEVDVKATARSLKGTYPGSGNVLVTFRADSRGGNIYASAETGRTINININNPSWQSVEARAAVAAADSAGRWHSAGRPHSVIEHELGHLFHYRNNPANYLAVHQAGDAAGWEAADRLGAVPSGLGRFGASEGQALARQVSRYAATNPLEFVAEVYGGLAGGQTYSREIMEMYYRLGGIDPIRPRAAAPPQDPFANLLGPTRIPVVVPEGKPKEVIPEGPDGEEIRRVLTLHDQGKSYREIEGIMGWPNSNGNRPWKIVKKYWTANWEEDER